MSANRSPDHILHPADHHGHGPPRRPHGRAGPSRHMQALRGRPAKWRNNLHRLLEYGAMVNGLIRELETMDISRTEQERVAAWPTLHSPAKALSAMEYGR